MTTSGNALLQIERGGYLTHSPENTEKIAAYTHLLSSPNRQALSARAIADLKQKDDQNIDDYALECTTSTDILMEDASRVKPPVHDTLRFIMDVITTLAFGAGQEPCIRVEMVREDSTLDIQTARARAKNYELNNICTWPEQTADPSRRLFS